MPLKIPALFLLSALGACAATPAELDALIGAARNAPGEFASDAMIRLASLEQIEKNRRIELLEQAFQRASEAQQPYKRHAAPMRQDGSVGYWNRVFNQDLDGLSLRLRAVEAMLPLDAGKARALFQQIPAVKPPRLTCEDFMVYDVGRFYDVLGSLALPFQLLDGYAGSLNSAVQVAPLARAIAAAPVKDADFKTLVASFAGALGKLYGDDRSFTYSATAAKDIQALVVECNRRKVSPLPLLEAYRLYLVVHLSAARCADDDLMQGGKQSFAIPGGLPKDQVVNDVVSFFNEKLRMAPLQPIPEEEATPARLEGVATGMRTCQDMECRSIGGQYRNLVFGANGAPYPPAERESAEWQAKLRLELDALSAWKQTSGATPAEYFREKAGAYGEILSLAPNAATRELILKAIVDFVKGNPFQSGNRVEWFLPVNALIGRIGLDPLGLGQFAGLLRKSGDPVIALYVDLEATAPRTPDRILPLL